MPELPEVECVKLGLEEIIGQTVVKSKTNYPALWGKSTLSPKVLKGQKLNEIKRKGKYLLLMFEKHQLLVHLGMSGVLTYNHNRRNHTHFEVEFEKGELLYSDPRKFGYLDISEKGQELSRWENLGVDAIERSFTAKSFLKSIESSQRNMKAILLDQKIVAGVGNIYASEALFSAGISPDKKGSEVNLKECELLVKAIKLILKSSIKNRGTTFSDYRLTNGKGGAFQSFLKVFQKEGEPCPKCKSEIKKKVHQNRSTFYCEKCQKV